MKLNGCYLNNLNPLISMEMLNPLNEFYGVNNNFAGSIFGGQQMSLSNLWANNIEAQYNPFNYEPVYQMSAQSNPFGTITIQVPAPDVREQNNMGYQIIPVPVPNVGSQSYQTLPVPSQFNQGDLMGNWYIDTPINNQYSWISPHNSWVSPNYQEFRNNNVFPNSAINDGVYKNIASKIQNLQLSTTKQQKNFEAFKKHISKPENIAKYEQISNLTDMPPALIAALHWRESSGSFDTYLHNGEKLGKTTTKDPKGIYFGKDQFIEAAADALNRFKKTKNLYHINKYTTDEASLNAFAEKYNGTGYYNKGLTSPYVFSGTTKYDKGKYTQDSKYDANAVDKQVGTAVMINYIFAMKEDSDALIASKNKGGIEFDSFIR